MVVSFTVSLCGLTAGLGSTLIPLGDINLFLLPCTPLVFPLLDFRHILTTNINEKLNSSLCEINLPEKCQ